MTTSKFIPLLASLPTLSPLKTLAPSPTLAPLHPDTSDPTLPAQLPCLPCPPLAHPHRTPDSSHATSPTAASPNPADDPRLPASLGGSDATEPADEADDALDAAERFLRGRPMGEVRRKTQGWARARHAEQPECSPEHLTV